MKNFPSMPPLEDSEDLTDSEVEKAVETEDEADLAKKICHELNPGTASVNKLDARFAIKRHELRRRKPHLYWRAILGCPGEPDRVRTYKVDWLQRGHA